MQGPQGIVGKEVPGKVLLLLNRWFILNNCVVLVIDGIARFVLTAENFRVKPVWNQQQRARNLVASIVYT